VLALGWIAWLCWVHRAHFVDDAFISLRYAANLLAGRGLVFNPGEVVEGVTNMGWVLGVAGVGWVVPFSLPVVAKGLGTGCLVGAVVLAVAAYRRLVPEAHPVEILALPLVLALSPELVYFSIAGMETGLAALVLVLGLWALLPERPRWAAAALASAALVTVRPEAVAIFPLAAALLLARSGRIGATGRTDRLDRFGRRRLLLALALFLAAVLAMTLLRYGYYGALVPNTAFAKPPGSPAAVLGRLVGLLAGTNPDVPPPYGTAVFLIAGAWGAVLLWRRSPPAAAFLAAAAATGLAFGAYAPMDWTGLGRYFAPYVPAAAILLVRGLAGGLEALVHCRRTAAVAVAVILALFAGYDLWRGHEHLGPRALRDYPGFVLASDTLIGPARWIDRHLPEGAVIAARRIGALGYFGKRRVLDYAFGLTDRRVARRVAARGASFETPQSPDLAPLWRTVRPGWVLEDADRLHPLRSDGEEDLYIAGIPYRTVRRFPLGDGTYHWVLARLRRTD
jgi:hypothetical protein